MTLLKFPLGADCASEQTRLSGSRQGQDFPVLFVHGLWGGSWVWEKFESHFSPNRFNCYAVDLLSSASMDGASPHKSARDYVKVIHGVASKLEKPVLIGHSSGALLAHKVAEIIDASAVMMLCPAPPRWVLGPYSPQLLKAALKLIKRLIFGRPFLLPDPDMVRLGLHLFDENTKRRLLDRFRPESGRFAMEISLPGLAVDPEKVACPKVVIAASEDRTVLPEMARKIAWKTQAQFIELEGFAHLMPLEPGWERAASCIERWCLEHLLNDSK